MKKWLLPGTAALAVIMAVAGGTFALAGGFSGDDGPTSADLVSEGECSLVHNVEGCDDAGGDGAAGTCLEGTDDCDDTVSDGDGLAICAPGVTKCDDMIVDPDAPVNSGDGIAPDECSAVHNIDRCQEFAVEAAFADFESRLGAGAGEITVAGVESAEWPDSCLGVQTPDVVCAEVITPGFKILLDAGIAAAEYHTNIDGTAIVLAEPGE